MLHRLVEDFWKTESFGSACQGQPSRSIEDHRAQTILDSTTRLVDGHYEVGMLWRRDNTSLPNNRVVAAKRLDSLKNKLSRDPELHAKYKGVIEGYIENGYARKLTDEEIASSSPITWHLPHHPVFNPNKPGKLRVVFDAAAKYRGTSLNDNLVSGPDLLNSLVGILLRFRRKRVGIMADCEAMFHQVRVRESDRDALRLLWMDASWQVVEYQMLVHVFGATSSPCCAEYALRRTALDNTADFDKKTIEAVLHDFYVDDLLSSCDSVPSAIKLATRLMELLQRGGFRLTKWASNSKQVQ